jgi:hypothetical protein
MSTTSDNEKRRMQRRNEDKQLMKEALKEAIKEWINEGTSSFGKWVLRLLGGAAFFALLYFLLWINGWHIDIGHN